MKLTGTLRFVDLGPGQWVLETSSKQYALFGDIDRGLADRKVMVSGQSVQGQSASMIGADGVMVESIRPA